MAFPIPGDKFPNDEWALAFQQFDMNDALASGDQAKKQAVFEGYGSAGTASRGDNPATHYNRTDGTLRRGGLRGWIASFFNGKIVDPEEQRTRISAPVAGNLATLSADLLTAEPLAFRLMDAAGKAVKGKSQDRLDKILNSEDTHRTLSEAAELTAGLGATVLTAHWDRENSDRPWIGVTPCDAAIPEWRGGRLVAVNLYTAYDGKNDAGMIDKVYLHVERHEPGAIIHGLLQIGMTDKKIIGSVPLQTIPETEHLADIPGSIQGDIENTIILPTGIKTITAQWWRNLPTKTFRKYGSLAMLGRADFEGVEQLLDAIDEVWSSWMRDIKIARARLIVPETFLDVQGPGLGGAFDDGREILTALQFTDLGPDQGKISAHQFEIRSKEHAETLYALTKEVTLFAGYSMASYGERSEGGNITATEVTDRTTLTERTRDKKFLYLAQAMHPLAHTLMELDAVHYGGSAIPAEAELRISIPELSQIDPEKEARMYQYLRAAMAVSTDTIVREMHPDWDDDEQSREIIRIREEYALGAEATADEGRVDPDEPDADPDQDEKPLDEEEQAA